MQLAAVRPGSEVLKVNFADCSSSKLLKCFLISNPELANDPRPGENKSDAKANDARYWKMIGWRGEETAAGEKQL